MHSELESLDLPELVERLDDLEGRRTPVGWTPDDAVVRAAIERLIVAAIRSDVPDFAARRSLPCELDAKLRSKEKTVRARILDIGEGGAYVETDAVWIVGTHVELHIRSTVSEDHRLRVRGKIVWADAGKGVGVSFSEQPSDAHERRLDRFIRELLRHRHLN